MISTAPAKTPVFLFRVCIDSILMFAFKFRSTITKSNSWWPPLPLPDNLSLRPRNTDNLLVLVRLHSHCCHHKPLRRDFCLFCSEIAQISYDFHSCCLQTRGNTARVSTELDSIAVTVFVNIGWVWQILYTVSEAKIKLTLLILRRGALSKQSKQIVAGSKNCDSRIETNW